MKKVLLISGSNRIGNTDYILNRINNQISNSEFILLKKQKIEYCRGCLFCHDNDKCIIKDDINDIINKMIKSDLIIFGVPNYFDNVTGLFKNFIDRLHPLYKNEKLKNKKVIFIFIGGGKVDGTRKELHQAVKGLSKYLVVNIIKEYSFKALNLGEIEGQNIEIDKMIMEIKNL